MPKSPRVAAVTLAIATTALAAACSGSKSNGPSAGATPATTGAATTGTTTAASTTASTTSAAPPQTTAGGTAVGACSLASAADVAANYGEQFGAGQPSSPGGFSNCLFPPPTGAVDSVSFTVAKGSQADAFFSANQSAYDSSPASGIGDKAFVSSDGGAVGFEKGGTAVLVHVVGFEKLAPSDLQAKQEAFAKLLASRLS